MKRKVLGTSMTKKAAVEITQEFLEQRLENPYTGKGMSVKAQSCIQFRASGITDYHRTRCSSGQLCNNCVAEDHHNKAHSPRKLLPLVVLILVIVRFHVVLPLAVISLVS